MFEVVRYRGKEGIYSWNVVQKGFTTEQDAIECAKLCKTFQKKEYKYLICKEKTELKKFFEERTNIDNFPPMVIMRSKK